MTELALAPGMLIGGKYRLVGLLARGGMGAVWRAVHAELGVEVAIKFMDAGYASSPLQRARFAREAKAAAGLQSRYIVAVRDYGLDAEMPYLVMELLHGEDLGKRLHRVRRLTLTETAAILGQVAKGLRGPHEAGLVHRDLKPGNIFLARADDEEVAKVLDFGIAKDTLSQEGGEATRTGEIMGSPHYMSPEQVRGARDLDARSDVWALGVIAFRCLTGRVPFEGHVVGAIIAQILADPIPRATQVAPDLPPAVDAFFARALSRDRAARFATARELAVALATLSGAPPGAELTSGSFPVASIPSAAHDVTLVGAVGTATIEQAKTLVMTPPAMAASGVAPRPDRVGWPVWAALGAALLALVAASAGLVVARRGAPPPAAAARPPAASAPSVEGSVAPAPSAPPSVPPSAAASAPSSTPVATGATAAPPARVPTARPSNAPAARSTATPSSRPADKKSDLIPFGIPEN